MKVVKGVRLIKSYIARQPIFDEKKTVYGYELLYRDGVDNFYNEVDGDTATSEVLTSSFSVIGIERITQGRKAFVNFTKNLLEKEVATVFDNKVLVVEILEDVELTKRVITKCIELKNKGYIIALDDFVFEPKYIPLLKLAHIVKVDFLITSKQQRKEIVEIANEYGVDLLAEKIETDEEFREAKEMGYSYFQGYFFKKPEIMEGEDLPVYPTNYFQVLNELNKSDPDFNKVAEIIKRDMALSYKLLRLINSPFFGVRKEINSIKQALVLLGVEEVKKWFDLVIIKRIAQDKPKEVMRISLIRAKLAELLGEEMSEFLNTSKLFLMGLFSMIDVLMNRDLEELLRELPISSKVKYALLGVRGSFRDIYELTVAYEEGDWDKVSTYREKLNLKEDTVSNSFLKAIEWTEEVMKN